MKSELESVFAENREAYERAATTSGKMRALLAALPTEIGTLPELSALPQEEGAQPEESAAE